MGEDSETQKRCPICGSTYIVRDETSGEVYCARCGAVIDEIPLDFKPPPAYEEPTGYTKLRPSDVVVEEKKRKLLEDFENYINNFAYRLELPVYVKDTAIGYFLQLLNSEKRILPENVKYYAAAFLYIAARDHNIPLSYKSIRKTLKIESEKIMKAIRTAYEVLHIRPRQIDPMIYLQQVIERLRINDFEAIQVTRKMLKIAEERGMLSGKDIRGVIGGIIYIVVKAYGIRKTQREIARVCGITEVTIRNRFLEFRRLFEEITGIKVRLRKKTKRKSRVRVRM